MQRYTFAQFGCIPGIPGEFHAGSVVIIDEKTMTIIDVEPKPVQKDVIPEEKPLLKKAKE